MELQDFAYCTIRPGTKRPDRRAWSKNPLPFEQIKNSPAYGILCGREGFLAIDCDGVGAITRLQELFGGWIPDTWSWSSGKEGRVQFGFFVPEVFRNKLTQARYWENLPDGSQLDFRWLGCQSVLPPSAHPETGAYIWEQSPQDFPLARAPEWLIDYAISLKNRKDDRAKVRIPASVYSFYGAPLKIWSYAQLIAKGSGRAEFSLKKCADDLGRSISSIRRLLTTARRQKLLRSFRTTGDRCVAYPTAMLKIVANAEWPNLGEITEIYDIKKLKNLNIICTEAIARGLQKNSLFAAKKEILQNPDSEKVELLNPFNPAVPGLRVLWSGRRFLAVSERVALSGVSQEKISINRNVSIKTISRHLDNAYRNRAGLDAIAKVQIVQRIPRRMNFIVTEIKPEIGAFLKCGSRFYRCGTNIYQFDRGQSLRLRWHRKAFKKLSAPPPR